MTKLREILQHLKTDNVSKISDGHHSFDELYEFRKCFNALLFNVWSKQDIHDVHKSKHHHDGELCFGGGNFIVVAKLPTGQISNHYKLKDWGLFDIPERELPAKYDGHTPKMVLSRMEKFLKQ